MSIAIRTKVNPLSVVEPLRRQLRGETNDQVLYEVRTMEQLARSSLARQRFLLLLFGVFAGFALLLACIGIYGVLAYLTGQRVPEMGLRMALGASARAIQWLVLRQSLAMIIAGIGIGVTGALAAVRLLRHTVEGIQPVEPLTFVVTLFVLIMAGLAASFLPARRASRVDPMTALRQD
jgi:ABC-type antimicrobial peptide transport system permease subunit